MRYYLSLPFLNSAGKSMDSDATSTTSSEADKDSPLPLWDQAKPIPSGPAHQRPTAQTQQPIGSAPRPSSAAAGLIARPISYSSAVSGAAQGEGAGPNAEEGKTPNTKSKLTKQLSAPEEKSAFSTVNDTKPTHPGRSNHSWQTFVQALLLPFKEIR